MPQRIFESAEGLKEVRDNYYKLFGHGPAEILHTGIHSIHGTTLFHCEVCPKQNGESCSIQCSTERAKAGFPQGEFGVDGIKVY